MKTEIKINERRQPRVTYHQTWNGEKYVNDYRKGLDRRAYNREVGEYDEETRIYFSHRGENMAENFLNRRARPITIYKSYIGPVLEALGLPVNTKVRWSSKAGCKMCPCSPGFIVTGDRNHRDVWVTLSDDAPRVKDDAEIDPARVEALLSTGMFECVEAGPPVIEQIG